MSRGGLNYCCGWRPNHPSSEEQEKRVKIEEEEPEVEKKSDGSLVPFEAKNYPYPFVWLQPNTESKELDNSGYKGQDKVSGAAAGENLKSLSQQPILWNGRFPYDMSKLQSSNQEEEKKSNIQQHEEGAKSHQPSLWRGWFPFDLRNLEAMKQGEEQGSNQHLKDDDKKRNFPFPVFWMPYQPSVTERGEEPEKRTESDMSKKTTSGEGEVPSQIINFQPERHIDNKEKPERFSTSRGSPNLSNSNSVVKIIPVKQLDPQVDGDMKTSSKAEDVRKKKPLEECVNKESTSPRKTKLPPVCLRVEPLPKKRGTNGNSRSPSPPANKRKSDESVKQAELIVLPNLQKNDGHDDQAAAARDIKENISKSMGTQVIKVAEQADVQEGEVKLAGTSGDTVRNADAIRNVKGSNEGNEEPAADSDAVWKESEDLQAEVAKTDAQSVTTKDSSDKAEECKKLKFSDAEAATMIQAAYRGFEVRKSGTLKKLKKLSEVKEQVAGIKTQIQALESSCDVKNYDKQKTIVTEMIMGLLLKLDTVQGLHTSIRDVRKSIAKELVSLQESLDAWVIRGESSEARLQKPSGISYEGCMPNLQKEDTSIMCQREDTGIGMHDLSKIDHKVEVSPPAKICEKQVHETDSLPNPEELKKFEAMVTRESMEDEMKNVPGCTSTEYFPGPSDSAATVEGSEREDSDFLSPMADSSNDDEELELSQLFEGQDPSREMSNFDDVSKEEMGKETSNVLPLAVSDNGLYSEDASNDDPKRTEVSDDAVKDIQDVDEVIISNQEQVALDESQEGSAHESNGILESPIVDSDTPTEVPKESTNTCEAVETTRTEIPTASEAADSWEPDETVSRDFSGLGQQVDMLPEDQKEQSQSLIEVSGQVHDGVQFEQGERQGECHGWERDTGTESGSETAVQVVQQHECLNGVSSVEHDALEVEVQKEDHGQCVDSLSESGSCNDEAGLLMTAHEEEVSELSKECGRLANEENGVKEEELQENDYVIVSSGSEVSPDFCVKKSEERDSTAAVDKMEYISPVVITLRKTSPDSERKQHVTGANNQADEIELSVSSPTASQASLESEAIRENDRKLIEENEKLRDMMEKLLEAGNKQLSTISELSGRINDLEKKLARKKKKQLKCRIRPKQLPPREVSV